MTHQKQRNPGAETGVCFDPKTQNLEPKTQGGRVAGGLTVV